MSVALDRNTVVPQADELLALQQLDALLQRAASAAAEGAGEASGAAVVGAAVSAPPSVALAGVAPTPVALPASAAALLARVVHELARGNAVALMPIQAELTTQQAASLLNLRHAFLLGLLDAGELPYHCVGTDRRIHVNDLRAYAERRSRAQLEALAEMAREAQEMGIYDLNECSLPQCGHRRL